MRYTSGLISPRTPSLLEHISPLYRQLMQQNFFGTDVDITHVWQWLFEVPEMRLFESYSVPDAPNRWFDTWEEVIHRQWTGNLSAWPQTVGGRPRMETIIFEPNTQRRLGAKGRFALRSPAVIDILKLNDQNECLAAACLKCWNEKGARQRSMFPEEFVNEVDWKQFNFIVGKIQRKIKTVSPAKLGPVPIMPDAFDRLKAGEIKLWNWGSECTYPSPRITLEEQPN